MGERRGILYAIGDVHGRADLLQALLAAIAADAAAHGTAPRAVFLGDIIDRGPESRRAMELVIDTLARWSGSRLILGNHEEFLLGVVNDPGNARTTHLNWLYNGGAETLASYGIAPDLPPPEIAAAMRGRYPVHVATLEAADFLVVHGDLAFVHGGIDPAVPLEAQDPRRTRWIREEFLGHCGRLQKTVVHGHTPTASALPEVHANRIALDTGAVFTGHLTAAAISAGEIRFLATDDHGGRIEVEEVRPLRA